MQNAIKHSPFTPFLLGTDDPDPVMLSRPHGRADMVLCCDHAGNSVPENLHMLGLEPANLEKHIGLDVGVFSTSHWLAHLLNAPLIAQAYSRLVIDCNRRPDTSESIPLSSDAVSIPGNEALEQHDRTARKEEIFKPYHQGIEDLLQKCEQFTDHPPTLVAMHSFTREFGGEKRPWDIGVIYGDSSEVGDRVFHALSGYDDLNIGCNVPYRIDFINDYTLPVHAVQAQRPYVEIEICQDIIASCEGQRRLARLLRPIFEQVMQK